MTGKVSPSEGILTKEMKQGLGIEKCTLFTRFDAAFTRALLHSQQCKSGDDCGKLSKACVDRNSEFLKALDSKGGQLAPQVFKTCLVSDIALSNFGRCEFFHRDWQNPKRYTW